MGEPRRLGNLASARLGETPVTVLVPVGSLEQHGPHLPLDTDTRIATAVTAAAAEALGHLVAPPISYGASGEHQGFPGTISIGTPALRTLLVEYGRSACEWASRLVFINGHGGNVEALQGAVALLRTEGRDVVWWGCSVDGADAHAGHTETSLLLHLSPADVAVADVRPGNTDPLPELLSRLRDGGIAAVSASGVLGDPTTATAAEGARFFAEMVDTCVQRIERWQPGPGGMLT